MTVIEIRNKNKDKILKQFKSLIVEHAISTIEGGPGGLSLPIEVYLMPIAEKVEFFENALQYTITDFFEHYSIEFKGTMFYIVPKQNKKFIVK